MKQYQGTLLVVDDYELNRDMLSRRLKHCGYTVFTAASGKEALELIDQNNQLDLVLLDVMMPEVDGYQVLQQLRTRYSSTDLSVVMLTARDQSEDIVRALELGADDYVTKPIDFQVALARIWSQIQRKNAERALRESEERYALAAQGANDGLWDWDLRTGTVYYSDRWKMMLGYAVEDIENHIEAWYERIHPDDQNRVRQELTRHFKGEVETFACEYRMKISDGSYRWLLSRGRAVGNEGGRRTRMVGWQMDTTQRVERDRLTALPNRGLFLDRLTWASSKRERSHQDDFAVFYIGLDRFKRVNDTLGQASGDEILRQIAERLGKIVRPQDTLARMGGDEFAILAENLVGLCTASSIGDRILSEMRQPFHLGDEEVPLTASIGIVLSHQPVASDMLLSQAHVAMERAKSNGKDAYEFYREGMNDNQRDTLKLESGLRKALESGELFLLYQPQISAQTGMIIGVEALIRWRSAQLGIVSPGVFIPLAEETGLIEPIGEWVIREACRQNKTWMDQGLRPIRVAVNLSGRQFRNADRLHTVVADALAESSLPAEFLDLELTESLLMADLDQTRDHLERLHALGVHLSLDDFGTGYSSLSYLKKLPIDTLKIDQSFVRDISVDPDDRTICATIVHMAHSLRMQVIAEGVETMDHCVFLKSLNCDEMQGYLFSKPVPPEDIAKLLALDTPYTTT